MSFSPTVLLLAEVAGPWRSVTKPSKNQLPSQYKCNLSLTSIPALACSRLFGSNKHALKIWSRLEYRGLLFPKCVTVLRCTPCWYWVWGTQFTTLIDVRVRHFKIFPFWRSLQFSEDVAITQGAKRQEQILRWAWQADNTYCLMILVASSFVLYFGASWTCRN